MEKRKVCNSNKKSAGTKTKSTRAPADPVANKVQTQIRQLQALTKGSIPDDKRKVAMPLIHNLAFMRVKLEESRKELMHESIFTTYDNGGGQSGLREHPGFSAYNKLLATFLRAEKQLTDMMPSGSTAADELLDFLNDSTFN